MCLWKAVNIDTDPPAASEIPRKFSIRASPQTDIWESPISKRAFNAPILYQSMPLAKFKRARVTIASDFQDTYSQGGLIIILHPRNGDTQWVKIGVESLQGEQMVSVVGKDRWPDCSNGSVLQKEEQGCEATIEMVRRDSYLEVAEIEFRNGEERSKVIREIIWAFAARTGDEECWVGAYAAEPTDTVSDLVVTFTGLDIERM